MKSSEKIKKERLLFIMAAVLFFLLALTAYLYYREIRKIPDTIRSCVKLSTQTTEGCGVIIDRTEEEIIIATTLHVVRDWDENACAEFFDGEQAFGQIFGADEALDVCFLGIPAENVKNPSNYRPAVIGDLPEVPFPVYFYDPFAKGRVRRIEGEVSSLREYFYELDRQMVFGTARVSEGMSGSALFTEDGILAGMLSAGNEEGVFAAACTEDILKCYGGAP